MAIGSLDEAAEKKKYHEWLEAQNVENEAKLKQRLAKLHNEDLDDEGAIGDLDEREKLYIQIQEVLNANALSYGHG